MTTITIEKLNELKIYIEQKLSSDNMDYLYSSNMLTDDPEDYTDADDIIKDITDYVHDNNLLNIDVIYYENAMKYLSENDPSLMISLELAHDLGYTADKINSELLASLLSTQINQEEFDEKMRDADFINEIEAFFNIEA